jgi:hypothetical protein
MNRKWLPSDEIALNIEVFVHLHLESEAVEESDFLFELEYLSAV